MLSVKGLCYQKGGVAFLSDISFELMAGNILGVIGPNGAGKTTLMRALIAELLPSQGEVMFNALPVSALTLANRAKSIAMLSQFSELRFPYSVEEVVELGRTPHSSGRIVDADIVQSAMDLMDISYLKNRCYTSLSGGEQQRTQLARVMAQLWRSEDADGHRLLILDEPTTSLDLGHKQQLMAAIKSFAVEGVAVVLIEHDLNVVARYCERLLVLQCGHVQAYGDTQTTLTPLLIKSVFGAEVQVLEHQGQLRVIT